MRSAQRSGSQLPDPLVATRIEGFMRLANYSRTADTCATSSENAAAISARV